MIKYGKIKEIDAAKGLARVSFDEDGLTSDWLQVLQSKTKTDKFYSMPDVGEHVACVMDENAEDGIIAGAVYDQSNPPTAEDTGAEFNKLAVGENLLIALNRNGTIAINLKGGEQFFNLFLEGGDIYLQVTPSGISIKGNTTIEGNLSVDGAITATEGISAQGNIASEGSIRAQGEIEAGPTGASVKLTTHLHPTPAGPTSPPTPNT